MSKLQERCNELLDDWQITDPSDPSVKIIEADSAKQNVYVEARSFKGKYVDIKGLKSWEEIEEVLNREIESQIGA